MDAGSSARPCGRTGGARFIDTRVDDFKIHSNLTPIGSCQVFGALNLKKSLNCSLLECRSIRSIWSLGPAGSIPRTSSSHLIHHQIRAERMRVHRRKHHRLEPDVPRPQRKIRRLLEVEVANECRSAWPLVRRPLTHRLFNSLPRPRLKYTTAPGPARRIESFGSDEPRADAIERPCLYYSGRSHRLGGQALFGPAILVCRGSGYHPLDRQTPFSAPFWHRSLTL